MAIKRTFGDYFERHESSPAKKEELQKIILERIRMDGPNCDLNDIDVSNITNFAGLFYEYWDDGSRGDILEGRSSELRSFNGDISKWDVSNVTDMSHMFDASEFNGDISQWNVSNVKNMSYMFADSIFNGDISKWDVSNVKYMNNMFWNARFERDISRWNISSLEDSTDMFMWNRMGGENCATIQDYLRFLKEIHDPLKLEINQPEDMSKWLVMIHVVFMKNDNVPITDEDIDYIYDNLDRDCLVVQDCVDAHKAILHQEGVTWKNWKEDLQSFCQNTKGFSVCADAVDECGKKGSLRSGKFCNENLSDGKSQSKAVVKKHKGLSM